MRRKKSIDNYIYPDWLEEIIPRRCVESRIRRAHLESDKDDVFQEFLIRLLRVSESGKKPNKTYAFKTIRSVINNMQRKKARQKKRESDKITEPSSNTPEDPVQMAMKKELLRLAYLRIRGLDERDKALLDLRFNYDLSFEQIGKTLGCSESCARVRHWRIIKEIGSWLSEKPK